MTNSDSTQVVLVSLSGCSSNGKTTIAKLLARIVPDLTLIHEDDFFKHDKDIPVNSKYGIQDWDCVGALDFDSFKAELDNIRRTGRIDAKLIHNNNVDSLDKFNLNEASLQPIREKFELLPDNLRIVLVDGFLIYHDKSVASKFDVRLLIRAPYETLKKRRAARPGYQTLDSFWVDPPYYFDDFVYKNYKEAHAHLFIDNNVEGQLKYELNDSIKDFNNDEDVQISTALTWVSDQIVNYCSSLR